MQSAIAMPKTVAQLMTSEDVGWSFSLSTVIPAVAAVAWAFLICTAVSGWAVWISQPKWWSGGRACGRRAR
jgi:hypothetical protein